MTLLLQAEVVIEKEKLGALKAELATDLKDAKPAWEYAQKAVSGITRKQLDELRYLKKPPHLVEKTLGAVCLLMGKKTKGDWKKVTKEVANKYFIRDILLFDINEVTAKTLKKVTRMYINDEE